MTLTYHGSAFCDLIWHGGVDDAVYIVLPGSFIISRIRSQSTCYLRCNPVRDTACRRFGIDVGP